MNFIHGIAVFLSLSFMAIVLFLVYRRKLREEYSLLWLIGGVIFAAFSLSPALLRNIARWLGVSYSPSLLFVIAILLLIIIVLSQAVSITTLARRDRDLTQKTAILEWRLEKYKEEHKESSEQKS